MRVSLLCRGSQVGSPHTQHLLPELASAAEEGGAGWSHPVSCGEGDTWTRGRRGRR